MQKTKSELSSEAQVIKVETASKANTANRVGGMLRNIIDSMQLSEFYTDANLFPATGESATLYVDTTNRLIKIWDGIVYQTIAGATPPSILAEGTGDFSVKALNDSTTTASGGYSVALGEATTATAQASMAINYDNIASGQASFATGQTTQAIGQNSISGGVETVANGNQSVAFGLTTQAIGDNSFAQGNQTTASGSNSFATGVGTVAGDNAAAFGEGTIASELNQIAIGKFNANTGNELFMIGNGASNIARSNAFTVTNEAEIITSGGPKIKFIELNAVTAPGVPDAMLTLRIDGTEYRVALTTV
jgi:hypothetical protein